VAARRLRVGGERAGVDAAELEPAALQRQRVRDRTIDRVDGDQAGLGAASGAAALSGAIQGAAGIGGFGRGGARHGAEITAGAERRSTRRDKTPI
jgi:hypothetical protein